MTIVVTITDRDDGREVLEDFVVHDDPDDQISDEMLANRVKYLIANKYDMDE
jgi:hypothetical protein